MNTLKKLVLAFIFIWVVNEAGGQTKEETREIRSVLWELRDYSIEFDTYSMVAERNERYIAQRDSIGKRYKDLVREIKYGPRKDRFLAFLDQATGPDSVRHGAMMGYNYMFVNEILSIRRSKLPTLLEYYKAVRYSLFEKDEDMLLHMRDIPFLKYKAEANPR